MKSGRLGKGKIIFLVFLVIASVAVIISRNNTRYIYNEGNVFGTYYHITYSYNRDLQAEIDKRLAMVDASLSPFNKRSIITAVNENRDVRVDTMFAHVFRWRKPFLKQQTVLSTLPLHRLLMPGALVLQKKTVLLPPTYAVCSPQWATARFLSRMAAE